MDIPVVLTSQNISMYFIFMLFTINNSLLLLKTFRTFTAANSSSNMKHVEENVPFIIKNNYDSASFIRNKIFKIYSSGHG